MNVSATNESEYTQPTFSVPMSCYILLTSVCIHTSLDYFNKAPLRWSVMFRVSPMCEPLQTPLTLLTNPGSFRLIAGISRRQGMVRLTLPCDSRSFEPNTFPLASWLISHVMFSAIPISLAMVGSVTVRNVSGDSSLSSYKTLSIECTDCVCQTTRL